MKKIRKRSVQIYSQRIPATLNVEAYSIGYQLALKHLSAFRRLELDLLLDSIEYGIYDACNLRYIVRDFRLQEKIETSSARVKNLRKKYPRPPLVANSEGKIPD
jgi:hypothetical protein